MANTKNVGDRSKRKELKRELRKKLKETFAGLGKKEKREFGKSETKGLRAWIAEKKS